MFDRALKHSCSHAANRLHVSSYRLLYGGMGQRDAMRFVKDIARMLISNLIKHNIAAWFDASATHE
jgi:hypothetical protein